MPSRPRYAELADDLRRDIQTGALAPGDLLPTEMEIAAARRLSRSTVRAALTRLADLGLVSRQQGVGTRVLAPPAAAGYDASIATMEELVHFGRATDRRVRDIAEIVVDETTAGRLDLKPGSRWIRIETVRAATASGAAPICRTEIYFDPTYRRSLDGLEAHTGLICDLLRDSAGVEIDAVDQIIRPALVDRGSADVLDAAAGAPALEILRRYRSAGRTIYVTSSLHPGDRFDYRMTLRRHKPAG